VIPLAIVISNFVHFLLGWAVYFIAYFAVLPLLHIGGTPVLRGIVWIPLIILAELILVVGCSLWSAALNMFYEDVKFLLQTLFGLVYFVFPILYVADVVRYSSHIRQHPWLFNVYMLNPIAALITGFRAALLEPQTPDRFNPDLKGLPPVAIPAWVYCGAFLICVFMAWSGYAYFNARKWKFVERS
jgi:ABC-2 type transport system permease protein